VLRRPCKELFCTDRGTFVSKIGALRSWLRRKLCWLTHRRCNAAQNSMWNATLRSGRSSQPARSRQRGPNNLAALAKIGTAKAQIKTYEAVPAQRKTVGRSSSLNSAPGRGLLGIIGAVVVAVSPPSFGLV
jgi:hypothetical protein